MFFCSSLAKIRGFAKFAGVSATILWKASNKMATTGSFFVAVSCVIHRYNVYKEVWRPNIGEILYSGSLASLVRHRMTPAHMEGVR